MNKFSFSGLNDESNQVVSQVGGVDVKTSLSEDFIIPEANSDVKEILFHTASASGEERTLEGSTLTVRGDVCHKLLILCENGEIEGVTYQQRYEARDLIPSEEGVAPIFCAANINASCNIVNPRKLNLLTDVLCPVKLLKTQSTAVKIDGTECIDDEISIQRNACEKLGAQIVTKEISGVSVSRDIELDGNYPQMAQIIYYDIGLTPYEIKAKDNGIIIRTKAKASIVYKSEEGNIFAFDKTFVIEENAEYQNASQHEWFADAEASELTCEISANNYGEMRIAELDFTYMLMLKGIRNVKVNTVTDVYSTEYCCELASEEARVFNHKRTYLSSLSVNAYSEREAADAVNARAVLIGDVRIINVICEFNEDKKKLIVSADAEITAVCENNLFDEGDNKYSKCSFTIPFKCEQDAGDADGTLCYTPAVFANDVRFRLDSSKLYCDFEASVKVEATDTNDISYVKTVVIDKGAPIISSPVPMTLCYPSGKETLWDIAKYYSVTRESIMFTNDLDSEDIDDKKVLLISSYKNGNNRLTKVI